MTIRKPKKWGSVKPSVGFGVDWSDPINSGLIGCWLFNEGAGGTLYDIAQKHNGAGTALTWSPGAFGSSGKFDGSTSIVTVSAVPTMANPWTISGWVKWTTLTNLGGAFGFSNGTNGVSAGSTATNLKILSNGETPGNGTTALATGKWYHVAMAWDGTLIKAYLNGVFEYSVTPSGVNWKSATATKFGKNEPGNTFFTGQVDAVRTHARALSAWEIMRLYREAFAGVLAPRRRLWNSVAAGGNVPTNITLAQASWVWTGQAITIDAKTMIALAQGAWTWTGRAASLNAKNMITLAQGVWRWTGIPIGGLVTGAVNYLLGLLGVGL